MLISCENTKITTSCWTLLTWTLLTRQCWNPPKKNDINIQGQRRSHNKMVGEVQTHLKSNLRLQRRSKGANKTLCTAGSRERSSDLHKRQSQTFLWLWRHKSAVVCHRDRGSSSTSPGSCSTWPKFSWRRSSLAPLYNHQVGDPQTGEQLYQTSSCTVVKLLGPTMDFPT